MADHEHDIAEDERGRQGCATCLVPLDETAGEPDDDEPEFTDDETPSDADRHRDLQALLDYDVVTVADLGLVLA